VTWALKGLNVIFFYISNYLSEVNEGEINRNLLLSFYQWETENHCRNNEKRSKGYFGTMNSKAKANLNSELEMSKQKEK